MATRGKLTFEVSGEGTLPRISIAKPTVRNKKGQPLLLFKRILVGQSQTLPLVIRNDGTLPSKVFKDSVLQMCVIWILFPPKSLKSKECLLIFSKIMWSLYSTSWYITWLKLNLLCVKKRGFFSIFCVFLGGHWYGWPWQCVFTQPNRRHSGCGRGFWYWNKSGWFPKTTHCFRDRGRELHRHVWRGVHS